MALNSGRSAVSVHSNRTDFGGRDDGPGALEPAQGKLPVDLVPGGHGVGRDLDPEPQVEQFERRLGHADVGLDARDRDVADIPAVELFEKLGDGAAMKGRLGRPLRYQLGDAGRASGPARGDTARSPRPASPAAFAPRIRCDHVGDHPLAVRDQLRGACPAGPRPSSAPCRAVNRWVRRIESPPPPENLRHSTVTNSGHSSAAMLRAVSPDCQAIRLAEASPGRSLSHPARLVYSPDASIAI